MKVFIRGLSTFLPNAAVVNDQVEEILGYVDGKRSKAKRIVFRNNGILKRHYALDPETRLPTHTNAELCSEAIYKLAREFSLDLSKVELLSSGTSMPDQLLPAHANMVQGKVPQLNCEVATLSGVCMASSMALKYAYASIKSALIDNAIVTGSEIASHHLRAENYSKFESRTETEIEAKPEYIFEQDFLRWMLSDGAAAAWISNTAMENGISLEIEWIDTHSYANELPPCMYMGIDPAAADPRQATWSQLTRAQSSELNIMNLTQDVRLLHDNIIEYMLKKPLSKVRKARGLMPGDVDYFIPHYSSKHFREKLFNGLKEIDFEIPYEKWFTTISERGNIGSASFFVYLHDFLQQVEVQDGQRIFAFVPESGRFSTCYMLLKVHRNKVE